MYIVAAEIISTALDQTKLDLVPATCSLLRWGKNDQGNRNTEEMKQMNNGEEKPDKILKRRVKEVKDSCIEMATLVATVTFTASITMHAGYINEMGSKSRLGVPQF